MATHVTEVGNGLISVERDGDILTGVTTGIPTNSFTIRKLASGKRQNGWLVRGEELQEWRSKGLVENEGTIYATGPVVRGLFVDDAFRDKTRDRLKDLETIASALATLGEAEVSVGRIHTRCMLLLDDGGALLLPPDIVRTIREHQDLESQLRTTEQFNHPDLETEDNAGFFLATITYYVLTDRYPFEADNASDLHSRIRGGKPVEARHRHFHLRKDISDALGQTLSRESYEASPSVWAERIRSWSEEGFEVDLPEGELESVRAEAEAEVQKIDRAFDRQESVRKNWRRWAIIAAIVLVVGAVPATIIRNALQPRVTAGLSAAQVAEVFYTSVNFLDHMTMEDAVVDKAGRPLVREVTNMFVIDRQRQGVEMRSGLMDAKVWREEGMPAITDDRVPYGVFNVDLQPIDAPPEEEAYRVTYERWLPNTVDDPENPPARRYVGLLIVDEVRLRQDKDDWVIYELNSISADELDVELLRQEFDQSSTDQAGD